MSKPTSSVLQDEEEEIDFMSDEFLKDVTQKDVRPGLLYNSRDKRAHELKKKQIETDLKNRTNPKKSLQQLQDEQRTEKLSQQIDTKNKGFLLLQKMGFKAGTSLGPRQNGLKEPISIEMKRSRGGLGIKTQFEEKKRKIEERREERDKLIDPASYRARLRDISDIKDTLRDLKQAQSSCKILDATACLSSPTEKWFWPEVQKSKSDSEDDSSDDDDGKTNDDFVDEDEVPEPEPREKLNALVTYLRDKYFYCIWCGIAYENKEDFTTSCPGLTKEDH